MKRLPIIVVSGALLVALIAVVAATWAQDDLAPAMGKMAGAAAVAGEPDYLSEMIAHHEEAITAAGELARSGRPQLRALGRSVVTTQSAQVEQMRTWLGDWYPDQPADADYRPMMRDLSALAGDRLDRTFLEDMIGHHMGAVMMSQHLLRQGTAHPEVARLAETIRDEQRAEIVRMQRWLAQWFDGSTGCGPGMSGMPGMPGPGGDRARS